MRPFHLALAAALALTSAAGTAQAATAKKPPAKAAGKAAAKKAPAKKTSKKAVKPVPVVVAPAAPARDPAAPLTEEEIQLARWVEQGTFPCEVSSATLTADESNPGYFNLRYAGTAYRMSPRKSITGAMRLEDPSTGAVWLQLANKSLLLNERQGRRLADNCMSPGQKRVAAELASKPAVDIFAPKPVVAASGASAAAGAVAASAPAPAHAASAPNAGVPVIRAVEIPPAVVNDLPSVRAEAASNTREASIDAATKAADKAATSPNAPITTKPTP